MLFHNYSDDPTLFKRPVETGNHGVSCLHHLRPIGPPLNPMECGFSCPETTGAPGCRWSPPRCGRHGRQSGVTAGPEQTPVSSSAVALGTTKSEIVSATPCAPGTRSPSVSSGAC